MRCLVPSLEDSTLATWKQRARVLSFRDKSRNSRRGLVFQEKLIARVAIRGGGPTEGSESDRRWTAEGVMLAWKHCFRFPQYALEL